MTVPIETTWKKLHDARHAWAFRAHDDFMASLSAEVRERMGHKSADKEAYVVVFGQTQVGKTTLILDLMGVAPEAMNRVSTILRGGRAAGRSATATTMEYRRSPDDRWGLRQEEQTQWVDTDEDMTCTLCKLRAEMEGRRLLVTRPCRVYVPADCFGSDSDQTPVSMLDLPGDHPANPVELAHVRDMAERYVPLADLILLVGQGDDLTFLQPGRLTLPGIENWQSVPTRFRVITTYSFYTQTIRETIRNHQGTLGTGELRQRLIEQIEKAGALAPQARQSHRFFPLEFGNSWLDARASQAKLYERVSPLIDELKLQLRNDIRESAGPFVRLKGAVTAHTVVSYVMGERRGQIQIELDETSSRAIVCNDELKLAQCAAKDAQRGLSELQSIMVRLDPERLRKDAQKSLGDPGTIKLDTSTLTVSGFREKIEQVKGALAHWVFSGRPLQSVQDPQGIPNIDVERRGNGKAPTSAIATISQTTSDIDIRRRFWRQLTIGDLQIDVNQMVDTCFAPLVFRLGRYTLNKYWLTASSDSDYQIDRRHFEQCEHDARKQVSKAASDFWFFAAGLKLAQIQDKSVELRKSCATWQHEVETLQGKLTSLLVDEAKAAECLQTFEQRMEKEVAESKRFERLLDRHYLQELRSRRCAITNATEPPLRLAALMAAVQLSNSRQKLLRAVDCESI